MADEGYFSDAVEEAKRIENKALEYKSYEGDIEIRKDVDFYPADYVDVDYSDLINIYERAEKIKTASKMRIFAPGMEGAPPAPEEKKAISASDAKKIEEVESRLKNITTEALKKAEEIAAPARPSEEKIELEKKPAHLEIELEREKPAELPSELELEFEKPAEKEEERRRPPEISEVREAKPHVPEEFGERKPEEERPVAEEAEVLMPKILESPDEAAEKKFKKIEEEVVSTLGERADETAIKKKMLELTKQLFKEKSFDKREEIKHEIAALKGMLASKKTEAVRGAIAKAKKAKKPEGEGAVAHLQVLQTLVTTQASEMAQTKDSITSSYRHKIDGLHKKFYEDVALTEDAEKKKKLYDSLVFELTKLSEQLPETIEKFKDYTTKKHLAEIRKIKENVGPAEKDAAQQVTARMKAIETGHPAEFDSLKDIILKRIDSIIRTAARDVFEKKTEEEPSAVEKEETKADEIISEISNIDAGTMLYYLHSKDLEYYKKYERKHVSNAEAIARARILMAKEKGLNADIIRKYFGTLEG
ncbi:hypothetical protein H0O02_03345 [Candidatus Micrarchaeota archaeon]|nr:hypothetical protein [Candidatus Micrarchaeota archaeon]